MLIRDYAERIVRRDAKRLSVLRFLRDETWSNTQVLARVLVCTQPAVFKTLRQLEQGQHVFRYHVPELRINVWGITPHGLAHAWDEDEVMEPRPFFEPSKLSNLTVYHHLDVQLARLNAERAGWCSWIPGPRLPKGIKKRPDAVATDGTGNKVAIEIERSIKTLRRYEAILSTYLQLIKRGEYAIVHYVCPDSDFAPRLRRVLAMITAVPVAGERVPIGEKHLARFPVFALENWPPKSGGMEIADG
jgi:hypothetical protein